MSQNYLKRAIRSQEGELIKFEKSLVQQLSLCAYEQEYLYQNIIEKRWWDRNGGEYLHEKDKLALLLKHGYVCSREHEKIQTKFEK
jgi:hypothetical protein